MRTRDGGLFFARYTIERYALSTAHLCFTLDFEATTMRVLHTTAAAVALLFSVSACDGDGPSGPGREASVETLTFNFFMSDASFNGPVASVQYDVPPITPSVVDNGAVLAFFREQGTWTAMPYTFAEESPDLAAVDYTITLGYGYDDQFLEVFYEASTSEIDLSSQPNREIRIVVIDGYAPAKSGVDLKDYDAVADYYGIDE